MLLNLKSTNSNVPFEKDCIYRFLKSTSYNWRKFLMSIACSAVSEIAPLTSDDRENVIIIDDSYFDRNRSKNVELLSKVYDHCDGKYKRGYRMLTSAWSDGNTTIPLSFVLLSSSDKKSQYCEENTNIDKRSNGYKARQLAISKATDATISLLKQAKEANIPAKIVVFDTWFASPKTIINVDNVGYKVVAMLKSTPKVHYNYQGENIPLKEIYRKLKKNRGLAKILASAEVTITSNDVTIPAKIVFVRNKNKKSQWLALISTDINISNEEIVRIYGKRWNIEVFFKMCKIHLALAKEFQCRSYDSLVATTSIVFLRYIMISSENRLSSDMKSFGELFSLYCDELKDISFTESLNLLCKIFSDYMNKSFGYKNEFIDLFLSDFISKLPYSLLHSPAFFLCES